MKKNIAAIATAIAMPNLNKKTLISMLTIAASLLVGCAASKKNNFVANRPPDPVKKVSFAILENKTDTVTIHGAVTDKAGMALSNVSIVFDADKIGTTDANGLFSFVANKEIGKIYSLLFEKQGYNRAVRTFNLEMASPYYAIQMLVPCICDTITCNKCFHKNIAFDFEQETVLLNDAQKKLLNDLIDCLKANPDKLINIRYNTLYPKKQIGPQRLQAVKNYLMVKGIMDNRIMNETITNKDAGYKQIEIIFN